MFTKLIVVLVALLVAASMSTSAASASEPIAPSTVHKALSFWKVTKMNKKTHRRSTTWPCHGRVEMRYEDTTATFPKPVPAGFRVDAWSNQGSQDCVIHMNTETTSNLLPSVVCTIVIHEVGHDWLGLDHSDTGVMMPLSNRPVPPVCQMPAADAQWLSDTNLRDLQARAPGTV